MIERWDPEKHEAMVARWVAAQGLTYERELLPPTGFVSHEVAAAWLYLTDASIAYVDNFTVDPDASPLRLISAVKELVPALRSAAKDRGARVIVAMPCRPFLSRILQKMGLAPMVNGASYFVERVV